MPYIKKESRCERWEIDDPLSHPTTTGELNYILTLICKEYYDNGGGYKRINDVIGALEGCKLEFYRRVAAPYEDAKIKENGDVY